MIRSGSITTACLAVMLASTSLGRTADPDSTQAKQQIQAAYDAGAANVAILHWPSAWLVDERSFHYSKVVKCVTLEGSMAQVLMDEDDSVAGTDPKTGKRHLIRDTATYRDTWKHTPAGWFIKKHQMLTLTDTIDGKSRMR